MYALEFQSQDGLRIVRALSTANEELARWDELEQTPEADVPTLTQRSPTDVVVDRNQSDAPLIRAHEAFDQYRYQEASRILDGALAEQPDQPLLSFLLAWACEQELDEIPDAPRRRQRALETVIRSEADDLIALVTDGNFPSADQGELLRLLTEAARRRPSLVVLDGIVKLSLQQQERLRALDALQSALTMPGGATVQRRLLLVDLLLTLDRVEESHRVADELVSDHSDLAVLAELGDTFGKYDVQSTADEYFQRAIQRAGQDPRTKRALLIRQARWHERGPRWRLLAEAAELMPRSDATWASQIRQIISEAQTADDADVLGELAAKTRRPEYRVQLLLQQAELTDDANEADAIYRLLLESGTVDVNDELSILRRLRAIGRPESVVSHLEGRLRRGHNMNKSRIMTLASAYNAVGKTALAQRAKSEANERPTQ